MLHQHGQGVDDAKLIQPERFELALYLFFYALFVFGAEYFISEMSCLPSLLCHK